MSTAGANKPPPHFFIRFVLPIVGKLVLLASAVGMLFVGFARLQLDCARESSALPPTCQIREVRRLGLYDRRETVFNVSGSGYSTQDVDTSSRVTLSSTVQLHGSIGPVALTREVDLAKVVNR